MTRTLLAAAVLLLASSARAGDPDERAAVDIPPLGVCECLQKKRCWRLVRAVFGKNTLIAKTEVEAAVRDRFFAGTAAFALHKPDSEGHFLMVQCGGSACADKRDELERRFIVSNFLLSLPLGVPRSELFNETTWEVTTKGEKAFTQAKLCKSGLLPTLIDIVHAVPPT